MAALLRARPNGSSSQKPPMMTIPCASQSACHPELAGLGVVGERVPGVDQLGEDHQTGSAARRRGDRLRGARTISVQVAEHRGELGTGDDGIDGGG
jgi:hypothetical protein